MRTPAIAACLFLSACGGGTASAPPTASTGPSGPTTTGDGTTAAGTPPTATATTYQPPAGFADADLIAIDGGELVTYKLGADKVERLGSVKLADVDPDEYMAEVSGDWADRDHFFVRIPPRTVLAVTATAVTSVTVPPESAFKPPKPDSDDEGLTEGGLMRDSDGLVVTDGAAWWVECPWGLPYDGWQCELFSSAKLWPAAAPVVSDQTGVGPRHWDWPTVDVKTIKLKPMDDDHALGCMPKSGTKQKPNIFRASDDEGESIESSRWISASPLRLLVVYGTYGLADLVPTRWTLHDGCIDRPLAQGTAVEPGPGDLWLAWEVPDPKAEELHPRQVVRRGAAIVGEVTGTVRFRPTR